MCPCFLIFILGLKSDHQPDDKRLPRGVLVGIARFLNLDKCATFLLDQANVLATFANDDTSTISRNGEFDGLRAHAEPDDWYQLMSQNYSHGIRWPSALLALFGEFLCGDLLDLLLSHRTRFRTATDDTAPRVQIRVVGLELDARVRLSLDARDILATTANNDANGCFRHL